MKRFKRGLELLIMILIFSTGCTTINKTVREPNVRVELNRNDFTLSEQVSAEGKSTKVLGIDFRRLFMTKTGQIESDSKFISWAQIPVIGTIVTDRTANYALYELMMENEGYDVVFYPQYETKVVRPILGIGFLLNRTTVKITARLGKL